ncbi:hypothetical protein PR003_g32513 [Phytophthora rubi]|uniref:Uncharacterized protein n=1 Tax=Phytophthora rubi TaxID=129364 RepID=A0A6A4AWY8_9STRA|nr:hypothetical protein PR002_g31155 [Phytophthora rubi]KAE8957522.1 hypothetical protein PR001_g31341 [Phytophthora rubi]KAE9265263.1 hypothetical protein PR003_g32513 [Phytophthora rubi]
MKILASLMVLVVTLGPWVTLKKVRKLRFALIQLRMLINHALCRERANVHLEGHKDSE